MSKKAKVPILSTLVKMDRISTFVVMTKVVSTTLKGGDRMYNELQEALRQATQPPATLRTLKTILGSDPHYCALREIGEWARQAEREAREAYARQPDPATLLRPDYEKIYKQATKG